MDKSSSVQASRLDSLEEIHNTLCLQSLHLGVDGNECSCALHTITTTDLTEEDDTIRCNTMSRKGQSKIGECNNTFARVCTAKGYCSWSVGRSVGQSVCRSVGLFARFLLNRGCGKYQTWIFGYMQRALGTVRVWSSIVQEQHVYGGGLKLYTAIILGMH